MATNHVVDRDTGWRDLMKRIHALKGRRYVKVGVLADDKRGGLHVAGAHLTIAEIAGVNELGTEDGRIPARSFIRATFDEKRAELEKMTVELLAEVLVGLKKPDVALGELGAELASAIKERITGGEQIPPPNAPSTALRKAMRGRTGRFFKRAASSIGGALAQVGALASVRTLVDTGRMVNAVTWAIVEREEK